jgi:hypothetical protein
MDILHKDLHGLSMHQTEVAICLSKLKVFPKKKKDKEKTLTCRPVSYAHIS